MSAHVSIVVMRTKVGLLASLLVTHRTLGKSFLRRPGLTQCLSVI